MPSGNVTTVRLHNFLRERVWVFLLGMASGQSCAGGIASSEPAESLEWTVSGGGD